MTNEFLLAYCIVTVKWLEAYASELGARFLKRSSVRMANLITIGY